MAKNLDPKCKQCRREGEKLFLKGEKCNSAKCPAIKRNYPPGVHGVKRQKRLTQYGQQLREKQKAKRIYGLLEKQFKNYYEKAVKKQGDTGKLLNQMLEMRFDNVIYRAGLANSRKKSRQMVNHGLFKINGKKVDIPSCQVKTKDEITINPKNADSKLFADLNLDKKDVVSWIHVDPKELKVKIINKPTPKEIEQSFNSRLIVEFYSR